LRDPFYTALLSHSLLDGGSAFSSTIQFQSLNKAVGQNMAQQSRFCGIEIGKNKLYRRAQSFTRRSRRSSFFFDEKHTGAVACVKGIHEYI
jgi:hypothetical protein